MNDQDSGTIITTFLLLLPWLGRAAIATVALWRETHTEMAAHPKLDRRRVCLARADFV